MRALFGRRLAMGCHGGRLKRGGAASPVREIGSWRRSRATEKRRYAERGDPGPTPEQKRHNEKIKQQCAVAHSVNGPFLREKSSDNWEIEMTSHYPPHRLAAKPIRIDLSDATIKINHGHLSA